MKCLQNNKLNLKQLLVDIMSYRRSHESDGMELFRNEYLFPLLDRLSLVYTVDEIGDILFDNDSNVLFVGHLDTVHKKTDKKTKQTVVFDGDYIKLPENADNYQVLGADCATGVLCTIVAVMRGYNGVLTVGEERGCIGANHIATHNPEWLQKHDYCIALDRFGEAEVVYHQATGLCASQEFARDLCSELDMGLKPSPDGIITDNGEWNHLIPECVNVSAGYMKHHSKREYVNYKFLLEIVDKLTSIEYNTIEVKRDVNDCGELDSGTDPFNMFGDHYDDYDSYDDVFITKAEALEFVKNEANHDKLAEYLYKHYLGYNSFN